MKKVFTLLFALGLLTAADAQRGTRSNRSRVGVSITVGNNGYSQSRFATDRMLREQVFRINQKYDHKIQQLRNDHHMRHAKKIKKIRKLEQQRQREISRAYANARFNGNRYSTTHRRF